MPKASSTRARVARKSSKRGFSLIELLIVVAIILIVAAIAVPNLVRARIAANEATAAANLRTLTTAALSYHAEWGNGYPPTLATLGGLSSVPATCNQAILIDTVLATPPSQKSGYTYAYTGQGPVVIAPPGCGAPGFEAYLMTATPISFGLSGGRSFCTTTPGVIHSDQTGVTAGSTAACDALPTL